MLQIPTRRSVIPSSEIIIERQPDFQAASFEV